MSTGAAVELGVLFALLGCGARTGTPDGDIAGADGGPHLDAANLDAVSVSPCDACASCDAAECAMEEPQVVWYRTLGGHHSTFDEVDLAIDDRSRIFVAHGPNFSDDMVDYGDGVVPRDELGVLWIAAYEADGLYRWRRWFVPVWPAPTGELRSEDLAVGASCLVMVGSFQRTIDIGLGPHTSDSWETGTSLEDGIVGCFDPDTGETRWDAVAAGRGTSRALTVAVDVEGNVAVAGRYWGSLRIGSYDYPATADFDWYTWAAVFDSAGGLRWSRAFEHSFPFRVVAGPSSGFTFALAATGPLDPGGGTIVPEGGGVDMALVSYAVDGSFRWQLPFVGESHGADTIASMTVTAENELIVSGHWGEGELMLGSFSLVNPRLTPETPNGFLALVDSGGRPLELDRQWTGASAGVDRRSDGSTYLAGSYSGFVDFGGCALPEGRISSVDPHFRQDGYVALLGPDGSCRWSVHVTTYTFVPPDSDYVFDKVSDFGVAPDGSPVFVGFFNGDLEIGASTLHGEPDSIFLVKLASE